MLTNCNVIRTHDPSCPFAALLLLPMSGPASKVKYGTCKLNRVLGIHMRTLFLRAVHIATINPAVAAMHMVYVCIRQ